MRDPYLYPDSDVLINKMNIRNQSELDEAEADFVVLRLKEISINPLPGVYNYAHLMKMHEVLFQDLYDWAGNERLINMYKEEPVLGGLSIDYSDYRDIMHDCIYALRAMTMKKWKEMSAQEAAIELAASLAEIWKIHPFREGNTRTIITFCCQYADEQGWTVDRSIFETNSQYVRTALVAYNAVFEDMGDLSKKEYLERIILDAIV